MDFTLYLGASRTEVQPPYPEAAGPLGSPVRLQGAAPGHSGAR